MISEQLKGQIRRLYMTEGWRPGTIARQLGIHRATVRKVLRAGEKCPQEKKKRPKMIDGYVETLKGILDKYPDLSASLLFRLIKKRGYRGISDSHFRRIVADYRAPNSKKAYLTIESHPAEEAQVDWAHFGSIETGSSKRNLVAFVMTLSYSRKIFLRFFHSMSSAFFSQGFVEAFRAINGVPKRILIDNCKTGVSEHIDGIVRFNPDFIALAAHYNFEPVAARVRTPTDKGKVERTVRYIRTNFGVELHNKSLSELNLAAREWCHEEALQRACPGYRQVKVEEAFNREQELLIKLPAEDFVCMERRECVVPKNLFVRFDRNLYSVPSEIVGQPITLFATENRVGMQYQGKEICSHPRSWDGGIRVENSEHFSKLREEKRQGQKGSMLATLTSVFPALKLLIEKGVDQAGMNLGSMVANIGQLRSSVGDETLGKAICRATENQRYLISDIKREIDVIQMESKKAPPSPGRIALPQAAITPPLKPFNWNKYDFNIEVKNEL